MTRTILCVDHSPAIGGPTRVLLTALEAIDRARYRAVVACNPGPVARLVAEKGHTAVELDLPLLTFAGGPRALARLAWRSARAGSGLLRLAREPGVAAIWAHGLSSALHATLPARLARVPLLWHVHETYDARSRMVPFVRAAAWGARVIVCVSRATQSRVLQLGAAEARCRVVYNAAPVSLGGSAGAGAVDGFGEGPLVVAVGSITPGKGHDVLVEAIAKLGPRHRGVKALVAGVPLLASDEPYLAGLKRRIDQLGLGERVQLLGFRRDVGALLARATLVVHPSSAEDSMPLVPLEAMAAGRAVIASRIGGLPETVADGETGLLVPPGEAEPLARAIEALLEDPERAEEMGRRGRALVEARFGARQMLDGLNRAFGEAAGETPFAWREPEGERT